MPNLQNAIKQLRKDKKRAVANLEVNADLKTLIKKTKQAITKNETKKIDELLKQIQKAADKAVKKGVIKRNAAARKVSRVYQLKRSIAK